MHCYYSIYDPEDKNVICMKLIINDEQFTMNFNPHGSSLISLRQSVCKMTSSNHDVLKNLEMVKFFTHYCLATYLVSLKFLRNLSDGFYALFNCPGDDLLLKGQARLNSISFVTIFSCITFVSIAHFILCEAFSVCSFCFLVHARPYIFLYKFV